MISPDGLRQTITANSYLKGIILRGISESIITCLNDLRDQIDETQIIKNDSNPLLEIQLCINFDKQPMQAEFKPRLVHDEEFANIPRTVEGWLNDFYDTASYVPKLDSEDESYVDEVKEYGHVKEVVKEINDLLQLNVEKCFNFKRILSTAVCVKAEIKIRFFILETNRSTIAAIVLVFPVPGNP
mgnify:CR=1 FL=1